MWYGLISCFFRYSYTRPMPTMPQVSSSTARSAPMLEAPNTLTSFSSASITSSVVQGNFV